MNCHDRHYIKQLETEIKYYQMRLAENDELKIEGPQDGRVYHLAQQAWADATITEALRIVEEAR